MIAPSHGYAADTCRPRHVHVECRIANHNCILGTDIGFAQRLEQHPRMRL